jgi:exocyst complex component 7
MPPEEIVPNFANLNCKLQQSKDDKENTESERQLERLHRKLVSLDSNSPHSAFESVQITTKIQQITKILTSPEKSALSCSILHEAMLRIEQELGNLLFHYKQSNVGPEIASFRSSEVNLDDLSINSFGDDLIEAKNSQIEIGCLSTEQFVVDLVNPLVLPTLKSIAELMFISNYEEELIEAYVSARLEAVDEILLKLRFEKVSIEELVNMEWIKLNSLIKRWNWAFKIFLRVYLTSERRLIELIFGDISKSLASSCFFEISKVLMLHLMSFPASVAINNPKTEKLFRVLDMYETLVEMLGDVNNLYHEQMDGSILGEYREALLRLGEFAKAILIDFRSLIQLDTLKTLPANGAVHSITRYVMNYIQTLSAYDSTLKSLLEGKNGKDEYYASVVMILESNLESRSRSYKDEALQNIFMMNNICYMVQKVKDSELRSIMGDNWIRSHNGRFQTFAMNYERVSWGPVLRFLRDEGVHRQGSTFPSKSVLKERFKGFNSGFEEAYRVQTGWLVPNSQLRDDLRISTSLKLLQAYRTFVGRYGSYLDGVRHRDRYIKYRPDELEVFILDLFEGRQKSLHYVYGR